MIIYKIQQDGYYGGSMLVPDGTKGIPLWTTRTAPPDIPEGKCAKWAGNGWAIVDIPPPPPVEILEVDSLQDSDSLILSDSDSS